MATYLATATTGRFKLRRSKVAGIPVVDRDRPQAREALAARRQAPARHHAPPQLLPRPVPVLEHWGHRRQRLRELRARDADPAALRRGGDPDHLAHEIAHQWFGDSVTPERWSEIWLNEGFATWAEWDWKARGRDRGLRRSFRSFYSAPASYSLLWKVPPGDPGIRKMFSFAVYFRGAMTLEALRQLVGDATFRATLRRWVSENRFGNASTADFIALAETESGRSLDRFFDLWLFRKGKPRNWR